MNEREIRDRIKVLRTEREAACRVYDEELGQLTEALNDIIRQEVAAATGLRIGDKLLITPAFLSVLRARGWSEGYFPSSQVGTICTIHNIDIARDRGDREIRGDVSIKFHDYGVTGAVTPAQALEMRTAYLARYEDNDDQER